MDAPQYVWELLERELHRCQAELLRRVAERHGLVFEELLSEFLTPSPAAHLVPNRDVPIVIHKQLRPKPVAPEQGRCFARVWNRGKGGQCSRARQPSCEYCVQHAAHRKHGDVRETPPRDLYPKHKLLLYK
jgi:hypothetical protein